MMRVPGCLLCAALAMTVSACAGRRAAPPRTTPASSSGVQEVREGLASYYGREFHGKPMANGAPFDMNAMSAAHPTYPFGTVLRVTNLRNGRTVQVRVLDRGPARGPRAAGVIVDLSYGAARTLGFLRDGRTRVRLQVLRWGE
jgi:rare lipoprotein A